MFIIEFTMIDISLNLFFSDYLLFILTPDIFHNILIPIYFMYNTTWMSIQFMYIKSFDNFVVRVYHYLFIRFLYRNQMFVNQSRLWRGWGRSIYEVSVEPPHVCCTLISIFEQELWSRKTQTWNPHSYEVWAVVQWLDNNIHVSVIFVWG